MLRFACQKGCIKCCDRRGSVYLSELDMERAAEYLGMTVAEFEARYVVRYRHVLRLKKPARGQSQCQFLSPEGCSIHAVKPTQCRTYPFWPSILASQAMWKLEGTFCPGIGKGELVQIQLARETATEMNATFPTLTTF